VRLAAVLARAAISTQAQIEQAEDDLIIAQTAATIMQMEYHMEFPTAPPPAPAPTAAVPTPAPTAALLDAVSLQMQKYRQKVGEAFSAPPPPKVMECVICRETMSEEHPPVQLSCGHALCGECLVELTRRTPGGKPPCPHCRKVVDAPAAVIEAAQSTFNIAHFRGCMAYHNALDKARVVAKTIAHSEYMAGLADGGPINFPDIMWKALAVMEPFYAS
jgi:hypothetical protein